jgi:hypothetical protein
MIIPNKFLKLDYNPGSDVLFLEWPNMHDYTLSEVKYIIGEVVDAVKGYDVKHILADTRQSQVTIPMEDYALILQNLAMQLAATRLQKFARLQTTDPEREAVSRDAAALVIGSIQYRVFGTVDEAMAWLTEK